MKRSTISIKNWYIKTEVFLGLLILQTGLFMVWAILIPYDQKNSFWLGFSLQRWMIFVTFTGMIALITTGFISVIREKFWLSVYTQKLLSNLSTFRGVVFFAGIVYFLVFLPADRLLDLSAYFTRLRPILVSFFLLLFEIVFLSFWTTMCDKHPGYIRKNLKHNQSMIICIGVITLTGLVIFLLLASLNLSPSRSIGSFTSNSIITPLQFFCVVWCAFLLIWDNQSDSQEKTHPRINKFALFIVIWLVSLIILRNVPFVCQNDMEGPFSPNNLCYPQVTDAPLPIGSYYITLGNGVFNQWFTDKPFYMLFLAAGQWVYGSGIDNAIRFQVLFLSLLPAIAFLFYPSKTNRITGLLFSSFVLLLEVNNIRFYGLAEIVNIKIPVTEILTALLLLLTAKTLTDSLKDKNHLHLLGLSGGLLGLATLTRLNPIVIVPFILVLLVVKFRNEKKLMALACGIFISAFLVVIVPTQLTLVNENGTPHSIEKVRNVLKNRYKITSQLLESSNGGNVSRVQPIQMVSLDQTGSYGFTDIDYVAKKNNYDSNRNDERAVFQSAGNIILLSMENIYRSFAVFPVNAAFYLPEDIYNQPLMNSTDTSPLWLSSLSVVNTSMLIITATLGVTGIVSFAKKQGVKGLIPLTILLGYFLGNGLALTSGGRFLQPVLWVMLFYVSIGLTESCLLLIPGHQGMGSSDFSDLPDSFYEHNSLKNIGKYSLVLFAISLMAFMIPATNFIQPPLMWFEENSIEIVVQNRFPYSNEVTREELSEFLENPNITLTEGFAYHPRIYDSPLFGVNKDIFEITILTDEKVYVSTLFNTSNIKSFQDGSRVILIGCSTRERDFWGVQTNIVRTLAVFQLNYQKQIYVNPWYNMECP